jgi:exopolysaccharide biosynthesis protein
VEVEAIERVVEGGLVRGYVARVDLRDPRVEVVVTSPACDAPEGAEARLRATDQWAREAGVVLAINANYFAHVRVASTIGTSNESSTIGSCGKSGSATTPVASGAAHDVGAWSDVLGLSVSGGRVVSPARVVRGKPDPVLLIWAGGVAKIGHYGDEDAAGVYAAVAGIGAGSDDTPGTLLVGGGRNLGKTARVQPEKRHPRTAVGVSADGTKLILVVVDGRRAGWSVGMTLPELADWMIEQGVSEAINLDGGGSSSFVYFREDGRVVENKPSDGSFRPVANHLGVRYKKEVSAEKK